MKPAVCVWLGCDKNESVAHHIHMIWTMAKTIFAKRGTFCADLLAGSCCVPFCVYIAAFYSFKADNYYTILG